MYHIKPMTYLELHCRGTHVPHKANDISGVTLQRDTVPHKANDISGVTLQRDTCTT